MAVFSALIACVAFSPVWVTAYTIKGMFVNNYMYILKLSKGGIMSVIHLSKYIGNQSSGVYACLFQRSQRYQWAHMVQVLVKCLQMGKDESGKSFYSREGRHS